MTLPTARRCRATAYLALLLVGLVPLGGCSLFRDESAPRPEVTAPEPERSTSSPPTAPKKSERARNSKTPAKSTPAPAPIDTLAAAEVVPPPAADAPAVTVQLSAEQRSVREMAYREDSGRASRAPDDVRTRVLSPAHRDQLGSADRFLADAVAAFGANDLVRACSLAQKARVLAEELKAAVAP